MNKLNEEQLYYAVFFLLDRFYDQYEEEFKGGLFEVFLSAMDPVSYTHLDVYKRQVRRSDKWIDSYIFVNSHASHDDYLGCIPGGRSSKCDSIHLFVGMVFNRCLLYTYRCV